jgi:hypothetical protein
MDPSLAVNGIVNVLKNIGTIKDNKMNFNVSDATKDFLKSRSIRTPSASVMSRIKDSIGYYPVLVSDSVSHNAALVLAKNIEARIAESIKIIIASQDNIVDTSKQTVNEFLTQFKSPNILADMSNMKVESDYAGFIDSVSIAILEDVDQLNEYKKQFLSEANMIRRNANGRRSTIRKVGSGDLKPKKQSPYKSIDVTKINSMLPTILTVTLKLSSPNGTNLIDHEAIIAVKANLHVMPAFDVTRILGERLVDASLLTRLIRWTTGELRFFRDIVAQYDEIHNIEKQGFKGANILNYIHFSTKMSNGSSSLKNVYSDVVSNTALIPNTTLILSRDDILEIKKNTTLDLLSIINAKHMMKSLGIMTFIVVDESIGSMRLLDDSKSDAFETLPLSDPDKQGGDRDTERLLKAFFSTQKR